MPEKQVYLTTVDAAEYLKVSRRMLEKRRLTGDGPRYCRLGSRVVYRMADLEAWAESGIRTSTSDPGPAA